MALSKISMNLCMLVGLVVVLPMAAGGGGGLILMGIVYGVVVGGCCYIFMMCVAFLLSYLVPKGAEKASKALLTVLLVLAPVVAGVVVYATAERMF